MAIQLIELNDPLRLINQQLYQFLLTYESIPLHDYNSEIEDTMKSNKLVDDTNNDTIFQTNPHNPKNLKKIFFNYLRSFRDFLSIFLNEIIHNWSTVFDSTLSPFYPKKF